MLGAKLATGSGMMVLTVIIHALFMGVIIFGWTTALIFYFIQHIYKEE